ncbi:TIGR04219 family outer membrane beta-barrel protein [Vibrio sagamiensis]|uniref:Iron-hydroxamate ABC transporter substrate-binding protein n=1 Tax=Vibrio sagamiensis NBRC 104589 TaxID=1219064 RepID=A0A511QHD6_9VIBR|nr:TIGR04219 family outer membrane beta-barrel protein [Vibrio sagamiensis]PNQ71343.1 iron-hydroxamate ABC transporter substrate-binding protein [Vibrio agarivorans]GEM76724.1 iron-hydroxamate ABC transporter substrate-binding protein [Vibrio sagamiensis NBRC 104589]
MTNKANIALATLSLIAASPIFAQDFSFTTTVGAEAWAFDTKVNEEKRESRSTGVFFIGVENNIKYLPNVRLRYSSIDANYMGFDKLDLSLYYPILDHDLMHFDAGITFSDLSNTKYVDVGANARTDTFDGLIWAWYGYAEISVPNTNVDVIGEMNFGDNKGIKSTDLMAGLQYRVPMNESELALRAGYRVIDLESKDFISDVGEEYIFANGFFASAEYTF